MKTKPGSVVVACQLGRHARISFSGNPMKEEGTFPVSEHTEMTSNSGFSDVLVSPVLWFDESNNGGHSSASSAVIENQAAASIGSNSAVNPIRMQFGESILGHSYASLIFHHSTQFGFADSLKPGNDAQGHLSGSAGPSTDFNEKNGSGDYSDEYGGLLAAAEDGWPMPAVSIAKGLGNFDAECMERLLVHCGSALESNDVTLAQQIMWVLNNVACAEGDPNQRLTAYFLRALVSRVSRMGPFPHPPHLMLNSLQAHARPSTRKLSVIELAGFVDLTPWHRFGFCASNGAISEAVEGHSRVHIIDLGITHCMQWPTLIDSLSKRPDGPPLLRLTVFNSGTPEVPPLLNMSYEDLGHRLSKFARSRNVPFQFRVVSIADSRDSSKPDHELLLEQLQQPSALDLRDDEALVVNCQMRLHYLPDETAGLPVTRCPRDEFLSIIRRYLPTIVTFSDEDSNLTSISLAARLKTAFNYLWIPFDALDTILPKDSQLRQQYEADVGNKIENIIAFEGYQRIERLESRAQCIQRIWKAGFRSIPFSDEVIADVKGMLDEHAAGWGLKIDDEQGLLLTWKGHNVVFASAWIPC